MSTTYIISINNILVSSLVSTPRVIDMRFVMSDAGPYFVTLEYWVKLAAGASADGFTVEMDWTDPLGIARSLGGTILPVNTDATSGSYFISPVSMVLNQSGTSAWTFTAKDFGGLPGAATCGFRVVNSSASTADFTTWLP